MKLTLKRNYKTKNPEKRDAQKEKTCCPGPPANDKPARAAGDRRSQVQHGFQRGKGRGKAEKVVRRSERTSRGTENIRTET